MPAVPPPPVWKSLGGGVEVEGAAKEVVVLLGASVVAGAAVVVVGAAVVVVDGGAVVVTAAVVAVPPLPSLVEVPPVVEVLAVVEVLFAAPSSVHPHPSKANGTPMTRAMTTTTPMIMYLSMGPLLGHLNRIRGSAESILFPDVTHSPRAAAFLHCSPARPSSPSTTACAAFFA
jgi:hypothetical protein